MTAAQRRALARQAVLLLAESVGIVAVLAVMLWAIVGFGACLDVVAPLGG